MARIKQTRRRGPTAVLAVFAVLMSALPAGAFQVTRPATNPGTRPAGAPATGPGVAPGAQKIKVTEVTGKVTVISTDNGMTWQPVTVDMEVDPGAIFRTGPKSTITCLIAPGDQRFTVESLSKLTVAEASRRGNRAKTDIVVDRGAVSYDIKAAGAEYESTVRTPSSTLAVRGTRTFVEDRVPFAPFAVSYTGAVEYTTAQRTARFGGARVAAVRAGDGSAAQTALNETVVDPSIARARTNAESQLIADQTSRGAVVGFDPVANIPVVRGGGPQTDEEIASPANQPGRLSIFVRWTGNADLNSVHTATPITPGLVKQGRALAASIPSIPTSLTDTELGQLAITFGGSLEGQVGLQEVLYPGFGLNMTQSGGTIPFDHRGGAGGGQEVAFWVDSPPPGVYGIGAQHIKGAPADYQLNAFLDGEPLNIFISRGVDENGVPMVPVKNTTISGTLNSQDDAVGAIVYVPTNTFFESIIRDEDPSGGQNPNTAGTDPQNPQAVARRLIAEGNAKSGAAGAKPKVPAPLAGPVTPDAWKQLQTAAAARGTRGGAGGGAKAFKPAAFKPAAGPTRMQAGPLRVTGQGGEIAAKVRADRNRPDLRVTGPRGR